jgi:hypothetical protein
MDIETRTLTVVRSARRGATTDHLAFNTGWSSTPLCGKLKTGKREFPGGTANCTPCIKRAHELFLDCEHLVRISDRVRGLITAVRAHATDNYNTGGWDVVVECWSDSELAREIGKCRTAAGAIRRMAGIVAMYAERRAPHDAEIAAATEGETTTPQPEAVEYDRFAEGPHPDGSFVTWHHDGNSGEAWGTRRWDCKVGQGTITIEPVGDFASDDFHYETFEHYTPGWRGVFIGSPNLCDGVPF